MKSGQKMIAQEYLMTQQVQSYGKVTSQLEQDKETP